MTANEPKISFHIDQADDGYYLVKNTAGDRWTAGFDKDKVVDLIKRLNDSHRPNVIQSDLHKISVCWNDHEKGDKCDYSEEI